MNCKQNLIFLQTVFALTCLMGTSTLAFAQDGDRPAEKWRPKDGTYLGVKTDPKYDRCLDFGDLVVELAEKSIGGNEWGCKIVKLTDTAPGIIRLDVACTTLEREKPYNDIIVLKKIDDKTILYRPATNGKFKHPGEQMSYCPEEAQRLFTDSKKVK